MLVVARARASPTTASAPRGGRPTRRWRTASRRSASRRSPASGRRSRCSPASRPRSPPPRTRTGSAAAPPSTPRSCAGSAPARCRRCGIASTSWRCRCTLVVGERDAKFRAIAERMGFPTVVVPGAGHAVHLEAPAAVAAHLAGALNPWRRAGSGVTPRPMLRTTRTERRGVPALTWLAEWRLPPPERRAARAEREVGGGCGWSATTRSTCRGGASGAGGRAAARGAGSVAS